MALFADVSSVSIEPELEPKSDHKFFGKGGDYPDDRRPSGKHSKEDKFDHPYPEVQDDDKYDNDYVADKNNDNGHWKAQMAYDQARSKLAKEKAELSEAKEKEKKEAQDLDE